MKTFLRPLFLLLYVSLAGVAPTSTASLVISGYLANPASTDSPYEYVQLVATSNTDFSLTPYSVVFANNGTATASGWASGSTLSYKLNLTTGTLNAGDVFYVGGSGKLINGAGSTDISGALWNRTVNTGTTAGDGFGTANSGGVVGNGGSNADGIAIFSGTTITNSSVPVDAVFYGTGIGTALVSGGTAGYQLPVNDLYSGGKLQSTSTLLADPASAAFTKLSGTYDTTSDAWTTGRTATLITLTTSSPLSAIASGITLTQSVPEASSFLFGGLVAAVGGFAYRRRRRA